MEAVGFLEALVRALGRGWSARYGLIAPYGVFGVTLTSDLGGVVEVVPAVVRGDVVTWTPFAFLRGTPCYEVFTDDGSLLRTPALAEAVAHLQRWRDSRGAARPLAPRGRRVRRPASRAEEATAPMRPMALGAAAQSEAPGEAKPPSDLEALTEAVNAALRGSTLGDVERVRTLVSQRDPDQAARALIAVARQLTGAARANALGVLATLARPEDGPELVRYLGDPDPAIQRVAIEGVQRAGYVAAVPALAALVLARDPRPDSARTRVAVFAAAALRALSGKRGDAALAGYLGSADPRIREAACLAFALPARPVSRPARELLEETRDDTDPRVARAATRALAAIRTASGPRGPSKPRAPRRPAR